jgi:ABC-type transport system involved in multi-copper enzyme maturation permease subunit
MDKIDWHAVKVLARKEVQQVLNIKKPTVYILVTSILLLFVMPLLIPILTALGYPPSGRPLLEGIKYFAWLLMPEFLYFPAIITNALVTDSFAGEKERKTIETLLVLPCSNTALILAKVIVALVPGLIFIFGGFLSIGIISNISIASYGLLIIFNEEVWYITILLAAPMFAVLFILVGILSSIVARGVKGAQGLSAIPTVPFLFMQMTIAINNITLTQSILFAMSGMCLLASIGLFLSCLRAFDREKFLLQAD